LKMYFSHAHATGRRVCICLVNVYGDLNIILINVLAQEVFNLWLAAHSANTLDLHGTPHSPVLPPCWRKCMKKINKGLPCCLYTIARMN